MGRGGDQQGNNQTKSHRDRAQPKNILEALGSNCIQEGQPTTLKYLRG
jgi:hypothetical protein